MKTKMELSGAKYWTQKCDSLVLKRDKLLKGTGVVRNYISQAFEATLSWGGGVLVFQY